MTDEPAAAPQAPGSPSGRSPVGFVGVGNMGRRMAANLAAAGFPLVIRDSDPGAEQRFIAAHGGTPGDSPQAFADTRVVVTMLPDGAAVREAVEPMASAADAAVDPIASAADAADEPTASAAPVAADPAARAELRAAALNPDAAVDG